MGLVDMAMGLATSQSGKIANKIGKSPQEVKQAMEKGRQILAQNQNNLNAEGARKIFDSLGIPPSFLDKAYAMASPLASFIPGVDIGTTKSALDSIKQGMSTNTNQVDNNTSNGVRTRKFDSSKYPKI